MRRIVMSEYFFIRGQGDVGSSYLIPDDFANNVTRYYEQKRKPFLQNQNNAKHDIYLDDGNVLHLGEPFSHYPDPPSWKEFYIEYEGYSEDELLENLSEITSGLTEDELDEPVYDEFFYDQLAHNYLPAARFVHLVDKIKIGTDDPKCGQVLGSLKRHEGSFNGSDVLCMTLTESITLSWLQWAMRKSDEPCNVHIFSEL